MREKRIIQWVSIGANLAVLLGLVFVGLEVRYSRAAGEAQTADAIADGLLQITLTLAEDTTMMRVWDQGIGNPSELTDRETLQFGMVARGLFNQFTRIHRLYRSGLLSEEDWDFYGRQAASFIAEPGGALFVEHNELPAEFLADLDEFRGQSFRVDLRMGRTR